MAQWIYEDNNISIEQELPGVPVSVLRIMKRRGVAEQDFEDFLSDTPKTTYDPFLLPDLKEVCETILRACRENTPICVYGDYDADGVTSTTLMITLLKKFSANVRYYIPSRFFDGYGPNREAFRRIAESGCKLLITVDCGITSRDEIEYAKSLGLECIVTDHHILRENMTPDCLTVNPHREDSPYPFRDLSGCGVVFKIAQGIQRLLSSGECSLYPASAFPKKDLNAFLDLVAISTVADVVPLVDENRCLVKYGLDRINRRERAGLAALMDELAIGGSTDASGISYVIAPNINALGRMGSADSGVELLESIRPPKELAALAREIRSTNLERKAVQEQTFKICMDRMEAEDCGEYAPVIFAPGAHEGVAGIVAGSLKEEMNRPVCIVSPASDGSLKGTGRSISGINLHRLFENCGDVFDRFGGHAGACGFTVKEGKMEEFRSTMQRLVKQACEENPGILEKKIVIEKELAPEEKTTEFASFLSKLEPFGEANPMPLFSVCGAEVSAIRRLGAEGQHIKFTVKASDGIPISCICFRGSEKYLDILERGKVDVAGEFGINEFRGKKQLQIKVTDIRSSL